MDKRFAEVPAKFLWAAFKLACQELAKRTAWSAAQWFKHLIAQAALSWNSNSLQEMEALFDEAMRTPPTLPLPSPPEHQQTNSNLKSLTDLLGR